MSSLDSQAATRDLDSSPKPRMFCRRLTLFLTAKRRSRDWAGGASLNPYELEGLAYNPCSGIAHPPGTGSA